MVDAASMAAAPRVVLLARAGKAADHLADALRQAGAVLLATADPANVDEAELRALHPQAVLVALEPSIEHMLDKLEGLLSDPSLTVIYDEADVAAHRAGWDAARWVRHLSAKLRHDSNVLPPGAESDQEWQPSPGQIPKPSAAYADADLAAFTREAVAHADSVPADGMPVESSPASIVLPLDVSLLDAIPSAPAEVAQIEAAPTEAAQVEVAPVRAVPPPLPPLAQAPAASNVEAFQTASFETMARESAGAGMDANDVTTYGSLSLEAFVTDDVVIESASLDSMQLESMQLESMQLEDTAFDSVSAEAAPSVAPMQIDDDAFFLEELSVAALPPQNSEAVVGMQLDGGFDTGLELDSDDADNFEALNLDSDSDFAEPVRELDEALLFEAQSFESMIASSLAEVPVPAPVAPQAEAKPAFSFGELTLAPVDEAPTVVEKPKPSEATHDLSVLESRISSLSLTDIDDSAQTAMSAAGISPVVLIEAGLGGPDPARQLLSSIAAEFPAVVLVRLHLQGGRYDRLVAQMERTAALPVALAESGVIASPGTIYFLPNGIGLAARAGTFAFVEQVAPPATMFAVLPAAASAIVFLSGSDPQLVDSAMAAAATGTLVIAQSAEDCYDGLACAELRNRGAASGLPAELAGRLASRWPS